MAERRRAEVRAASGRRIVGTVMPYGRIASVRDAEGRAVLERFLPGAFKAFLAGRGGTALNLEHDATVVVARTGDPGQLGSLRLEDGAGELRMVATLPPGRLFDEVLSLVADVTAEVSVEFVSEAEERAGDQRTVTQARLPAIGLVRAGAYSGRVEVRRAGAKLTGIIPYRRKLACECSGPDCTHAIFEPGSLELPERDTGDVLAVFGEFSRPLASRNRGTLSLVAGDSEMAVEISLSDAATAAAVLEAHATAGIYLRPYLDRGRAEVTKSGGTATYQRVPVRAIIAAPTDKIEGWEEARLSEPRRADAPSRRRRIWL